MIPPVLEDVSEELVTKCHDLLSENRVSLVEPEPMRRAVVVGTTMWYEVIRTQAGMSCDCLAGSTGAICAHVLAAGVVMAEHAEQAKAWRR